MLERPVLRGELIVLEPLELEHVPALLEVAAVTAPASPYTHVPDNEGSLGAYVGGSLARWKSGHELPFVVRGRSEGVVGTTRFLALDYWPDDDEAVDEAVVGPSGVGRIEPSGDPNVAEIGSTWLTPAVHGRGHNVEAKLLMLQHAFEVWKVARITMKTDARNHRSRRAIEQLGACFEGIRRAHMKASDGTIRDSAYFSIIADEWPACRHRIQHRLGEKRS